MRLRTKIWLGLLLVGLTPQIGCFKLTEAGVSITSKPAGEASKERETLPAAETETACLKLAGDFERNGYLKEAAGQLELARGSNPKLKVSQRLALIYETMGDYARALAEYNRELAARPNDADLLNDIGYCLYTKGDWAESEKHLRQAVTLNAKHEKAWVNLGLTLAALGRIEESLEASQHAIPPAGAYCNVAFVLAVQGKRTEAKDAYHKALELDQGNQVAIKALAEFERMEKREAAKPAAPVKAG